GIGAGRDRVRCQQEGGGTPGLSRHALQREGATVQPFAEAPVPERTRLGKLHQIAPRLCRVTAGAQGQDPKTTQQWPDATIVILPAEVLAMARHVRPPEATAG